MNRVFTRFSVAVGNAFRRHIIAVVIWVIVVLFALAAAAGTRSIHAQTTARLTSSIASVREAEVLRLAQNNDLINSLAGTEDPSTPAVSPHNLRSVAIRRGAALALNDLVKQNRLPSAMALNNLFALSKDSDGTASQTAISGLAIFGHQSDEHLRMLAYRMTDADPAVRGADSQALGQISGPRAAQLVAPYLANINVQGDVQSALDNIGKASVPYILPMLPGSNPALRGLIIGALGNIGDPSGLDTVLHQLDVRPQDPSTHPLVIIALAAIVLKSYPSPPVSYAHGPVAAAHSTPADAKLAASVLPALLESVKDTRDDSFARTRAALALGRIGGSQATAALITALGDFDLHVAAAALSGLEQIGPGAVSSLAKAAESSDEGVRVAAATALGTISDPSALTAIERSLKNSSELVRSAAVRALGEAGSASAAPILVKMLADPNSMVASAAGDALDASGPSSLPPLVSDLGSTNSTAALAASHALRDFGSGAVPALLSALNSGTDGQKTWAAVTLGQMGDTRAYNPLTILEQSSNRRLSATAAEALKQLAQS